MLEPERSPAHEGPPATHSGDWRWRWLGAGLRGRGIREQDGRGVLRSDDGHDLRWYEWHDRRVRCRDDRYGRRQQLVARIGLQRAVEAAPLRLRLLWPRAEFVAIRTRRDARVLRQIGRA